MIQNRSSRKFRLILTCILFTGLLYGQQVPKGPVSYKVFAPLILNPAIAGSKDFTRLHMQTMVSGANNSQAISIHSRFRSNNSGTAETDDISFSNFGFGGYAFHEMMENSRNIGGGISGAFHLPLGAARVSGLSIGVSAHALYNIIPAGSEYVGTFENSMTPGVDLGILYYGPVGFAGFSSRNLTSLLTDSIPRINDELSLPLEHLFFGGLKFLVSRSREIVFEPSLIVNVNDSLIDATVDNLTPILKVYVQNACFGAILQNFHAPSFFLQYQFPTFYLGVLAKLPGKEILLDNRQVRIELSLGLNLGNSARSNADQYRW